MKIAKTLIGVLLVAALRVGAAQEPAARVSLNADDKPLLAVLRDVFGQAKTPFRVEGSVVQAVEASKVTVSLTQVTLQSGLESILRSTKSPVQLGFRMDGTTFVIVRAYSSVKPAPAQPINDGGLSLKRVTLQLTNKSVKEILDALFTAVGSEYALHPSVQDSALRTRLERFEVKDTPFLVALDGVLARSGAPLGHTLVGGKYAILASPRTAGGVDPRTREFSAPGSIRSEFSKVLGLMMGQLDQSFVLALPPGEFKVSLTPSRYTVGEAVERLMHSNPNMGRIGQDYRGGVYLVGAGVRGPESPPKGQRFWAEFKDTDLRWALAGMFNASGESFTMDKNVMGTVTVSIKEASIDQALTAILKAAKSDTPITFRLENKVYRLEGAPPAPRK